MHDPLLMKLLLPVNLRESECLWPWLGEEGELQQTGRCADNFAQHLQQMYEKRLRGYLSLLALVTPDPNGVVY